MTVASSFLLSGLILSLLSTPSRSPVPPTRSLIGSPLSTPPRSPVPPTRSLISPRCPPHPVAAHVPVAHPFFSARAAEIQFLPRDGGKFRSLNPCSSVSKTFSKFVPPIRSLPALPIMFTNAVPRRKAALACVAVSMSFIRALGQSTSQIFGPSRCRLATPCQSPPSARARGAGAFGGVVGRRARSSWTSCDSSTFVRHSTAPTFPLPSSDPYDAVYVVRWAAGRRHRRRRPRDNLSLGTPNGPSELSRSVSPATRRPIHDTVCCTW